MIKQLNYACCFIAIMVFFPACGQTSKYIPNPEEQIVRELSQKRIVMLGDFAHEYPLPLHTLTSTLSRWLTMLEKGESDQNRVTLFLEEDDHIAGLIRQYLKNGDLAPLLDFLLPSTSIERLEFYADLRGIKARIDNMNRVLSSSKQIVFDVQGPEAFNVFDPMLLDSSDRATRLFFVRERDSLSARNVVTYLKEHPDQKALMFYGAGHLIKNIVTKPYTASLPSEERKGAFLASYLKKEYGDGQVFIATQVVRGRCPLNLDTFGETDALVLSQDVPWRDSPPDDDNCVPANFDAFIVRTEFAIPNHPLAYVFSRRIVSACIKRLEFLEPHQSGAMGSRFYNQALRALVFLSDTNHSKIEDWKTWSTTHQFRGLDRLQPQEYCKRMASTYFLGRNDPQHLDDLEYLGFDKRVGNPLKMSQEEWNRMFEKMWPQVVSLNAIGVYWIGDSDEQVKAKAYLVEVSGRDFKEPDQYLRWWRNRFFNVTY